MAISSEHEAESVGIKLRDDVHIIRFTEREVLLAEATLHMLGHVLEKPVPLLSCASPGICLRGSCEWTYANSANGRMPLLDARAPDADAPAVCVLDSGSTQRHPLISPALAANDQQVWNVIGFVEDTGQWRGHGMQMSGLALYGDLLPWLVSKKNPGLLTHRLESVKILPDSGGNDPESYGYISAEAVSRAEIQGPQNSPSKITP